MFRHPSQNGPATDGQNLTTVRAQIRLAMKGKPALSLAGMTSLQTLKVRLPANHDIDLNNPIQMSLRVNLTDPFESRTGIAKPGENAGSEVIIIFKDTLTPDSRIAQLIAQKSWGLALEEGLFSDRYITRQASCVGDYLDVTRLLYREYQKKGYCKKNRQERYCNYFSLLPDSRTILLSDLSNRLIGTFAVVPDTRFGLPSDEVFADVLSGFRKQSFRCAEATLLSIDPACVGGPGSYLLNHPLKLAVFAKLLKAIVQAVDRIGITDLFIATHPKHEPTYRFFQFSKLTETRVYGRANGNPAILMHVNLPAVRSSLGFDLNGEHNTSMPQAHFLYGLDRFDYTTSIKRHLTNFFECIHEDIPNDVAKFFARDEPSIEQLMN